MKKRFVYFIFFLLIVFFSLNFVKAETSNFDRITVNLPVAGQVSGDVNIDASFKPYISCFGNCNFGFFSAILRNADSSTVYLNRIVAQSFTTSIKTSFDTDDFPNGEYILDFIVYNPKGAPISITKSIPLTINNPPITVDFKYPAANTVITNSFLMDVIVTRAGQPYRPTFVNYAVKPAGKPDTEYMNLGTTYPAFNGGDSRGNWGCDFLPAPNGNYVLRAILSKGQNATIPITINWGQCIYTNTATDHTPPIFTVISPLDGDNSFAESITFSATAYDPGSSFDPSVYSGVRNIGFFIEGSSSDDSGVIYLTPDSSGMATRTWKVSDGVDIATGTGSAGNPKKVYPKPPFTIGVFSTDNAGNAGNFVYIRLSSLDTNISLSSLLTATITEPFANQQFPVGRTQTTLAVTTNKPATCKYDDVDRSYGQMLYTLNVTGTAVGDDFVNGVTSTVTFHTTTITNLLDGTNYTRYVRCQDSAGNAMTSSQSVTFSVDNPANPSPTCDLTSASWSKNNSLEGDVVSLNVLGENCDGKSVTFKIMEKDSAVDGDDLVKTKILTSTFNGKKASALWTILRESDGLFGLGGNPEYYFIASIVGSSERIDSGTSTLTLLSIDETPTYSCGDGTCNGVETNLICPVDCPLPNDPRDRRRNIIDTDSDSEERTGSESSGSEDTTATPTTPQINEIQGPLGVGSSIQLRGNTHVRTDPSVSAVALTTQVAGSRGQIIDGPVQADGYTWWKVDYETGEDGWSVDILMAKIRLLQ